MTVNWRSLGLYTKQGRRLGLLKTLINIFHHFLTLNGPNNLSSNWLNNQITIKNNATLNPTTHVLIEAPSSPSLSSSYFSKHTHSAWMSVSVCWWARQRPRAATTLSLSVCVCEGSFTSGVISAPGFRSSVGRLASPQQQRVSDNCSKSVVNSLSDGGCRRGQLSVWHQPWHISGEAQR